MSSFFFFKVKFSRITKSLKRLNWERHANNKGGLSLTGCDR